jgi:hypothetical protein
MQLVGLSVATQRQVWQMATGKLNHPFQTPKVFARGMELARRFIYYNFDFDL